MLDMYSRGATLAEIAREFKISRERVRVIVKRQGAVMRRANGA